VRYAVQAADSGKKSRAGKAGPKPQPAAKLGPKFKGLEVKPRKATAAAADDKPLEEKHGERGEKPREPRKSQSMTTLELQKALCAGEY
jgi:hypothetical protein